MIISDFVSLLAVGLLWGGTNPLIRRGSKGVDDIKCSSKFKQIIAEFTFLLTRWQYLIPFVLNQSGSLLYFMTLQNTDLSLAVPIANSLSFVFTAIVAQILGEQKSSPKVYVGMGLVIIGTVVCALGNLE